MKNVFVIMALAAVLLAGCGDPGRPPCAITDEVLDQSLSCDVMAASAGWAKVNTHTHTSLIDGSCSPDRVMEFYRVNCYDALSITDHNNWYGEADPDLLIIPGNEFSGAPHYTLLNYEEVVILNHPRYKFGYPYTLLGFDVLDVAAEMITTTHFEVFNGQGGYVNEDVWDVVLESGRMLYGVAADDAHFKGVQDGGRAWIMARVDALNLTDMMSAISAGDFYASTGVYLSEYSTAAAYTMAVDFTRTDADLCEFELIEAGDFVRGRVSCVNTDGLTIYAWGQPVKK
jgi:hypothetical protein